MDDTLYFHVNAISEVDANSGKPVFYADLRDEDYTVISDTDVKSLDRIRPALLELYVPIYKQRWRRKAKRKNKNGFLDPTAKLLTSDRGKRVRRQLLQYFGIADEKYQELSWIADQAITEPLPPYYDVFVDITGKFILYKSNANKTSSKDNISFQHPPAEELLQKAKESILYINARDHLRKKSLGFAFMGWKGLAALERGKEEDTVPLSLGKDVETKLECGFSGRTLNYFFTKSDQMAARDNAYGFHFFQLWQDLKSLEKGPQIEDDEISQLIAHYADIPLMPYGGFTVKQPTAIIHHEVQPLKDCVKWESLGGASLSSVSRAGKILWIERRNVFDRNDNDESNDDHSSSSDDNDEDSDSDVYDSYGTHDTRSESLIEEKRSNDNGISSKSFKQKRTKKKEKRIDLAKYSERENDLDDVRTELIVKETISYDVLLPLKSVPLIQYLLSRYIQKQFALFIEALLASLRNRNQIHFLRIERWKESLRIRRKFRLWSKYISLMEERRKMAEAEWKRRTKQKTYSIWSTNVFQKLWRRVERFQQKREKRIKKLFYKYWFNYTVNQRNMFDEILEQGYDRGTEKWAKAMDHHSSVEELKHLNYLQINVAVKTLLLDEECRPVFLIIWEQFPQKIQDKYHLVLSPVANRNARDTYLLSNVFLRLSQAESRITICHNTDDGLTFVEKLASAFNRNRENVNVWLLATRPGESVLHVRDLTSPNASASSSTFYGTASKTHKEMILNVALLKCKDVAVWKVRHKGDKESKRSALAPSFQRAMKASFGQAMQSAECLHSKYSHGDFFSAILVCQNGSSLNCRLLCRYGNEPEEGCDHPIKVPISIQKRQLHTNMLSFLSNYIDNSLQGLYASH
eukprot:g3541.t1